MDWDVSEVKVLDDYRFQVRFRDGLEGAVTLRPSFFRGVFSPLRDPQQFRQLRVVDGVVTWPGALDLAPDAMHRCIKLQGEWFVD